MFFGKQELEYLGYWITRQGIKPLTKKVDDIHKLKAPITRKQLRSFIGIVNYYQNMWKGRTDLLVPLTAFTSNATTWKWTDVDQQDFDSIKKVVDKETILVYPDFKEPFDIHTDASDRQLGVVLSHTGMPIAIYSRK